jgi:tetrahydromethanopterin S-methyltransferase subunit G
MSTREWIFVIACFIVGILSYSAGVDSQKRAIIAEADDFEPWLERYDELSMRQDALVNLIEQRIPCRTDYECEVLYPAAFGIEPQGAFDNAFGTERGDVKTH